MILNTREHSGSGATGGRTAGGVSTGGRLTPKQQEQRRRRQRALELHGEGKTLQEIADELGWSSPSGVAYALKKARKELREIGPVEDLEELRRLQIERYDALLVQYYTRAVGGYRKGEYVPPSIKHARIALRIIADISDLAGLNISPEEAFERASQAVAEPAVSDDRQYVMVVDFDERGYGEAIRCGAKPVRDEPIAVDDQPPAGRIDPRPSNDLPEVEGGGFEPNSTDPRTGEPIFDPRVALNATKAVSVEP